MITDDKKSILERVNFFVLFSFDLTLELLEREEYSDNVNSKEPHGFLFSWQRAKMLDHKTDYTGACPALSLAEWC